MTRIGILALCLLSTVACAVNADKSMSPQDSLECRSLLDSVLGSHDFPVSAIPRLTAEGRRAVYCRIEQRNPFIVHLYTRLDLYGVLDRPTQDVILNAVRSARQGSFKPIIVNFWEKENWEIEEYQGGGRREGRGREKCLRTTIVD